MVIRTQVACPVRVKVKTIARKKNPSESLSNMESRKAPNLVSPFVFLARAPSNMSKKLAIRIVTPAAINKSSAISAAAMREREKPNRLRAFGLIPVLASRAAGTSVK